jgi:hypothetical protein
MNSQEEILRFSDSFLHSTFELFPRTLLPINWLDKANEKVTRDNPITIWKQFHDTNLMKQISRNNPSILGTNYLFTFIGSGLKQVLMGSTVRMLAKLTEMTEKLDFYCHTVPSISLFRGSFINDVTHFFYSFRFLRLKQRSQIYWYLNFIRP